MDTESLLQSSFLCSGLDEGELKRVRSIVSIRKVKRKETLFFQGDPATGLYILLEGKVRIFKSSPEGKEYTLHMIYPGQMFAEAAVFSGKSFPANCCAMEDSTVAFFPKERFLKLLHDSPKISLKMIGGLSAFVREFNQKVEELSLKEIPARLAYYLLTEHDRLGSASFELDISKSELASRLGTVSETLSRALKKLRESRIIAVEGKKISILDLVQLELTAEGEKL
jgi:CRP/FNR family transcriptional regulator